MKIPRYEVVHEGYVPEVCDGFSSMVESSTGDYVPIHLVKSLTTSETPIYEHIVDYHCGEPYATMAHDISGDWICVDDIDMTGFEE